MYLRWTYTNPSGLTQWYGHVDYCDQCVIGQWFVLDRESGEELWSRKLGRPNTICGVAEKVIVASEMRSDGPWTLNFGLYGIDVEDGNLLWSNHGSGFWGTLGRWLDFLPGFTNDFRDAPDYLVDDHVITRRKRILDVRTGREIKTSFYPSRKNDQESRAAKLFRKSTLEIGEDIIKVEGTGDRFAISRLDGSNNPKWSFSASEQSLYVNGSFYSYRLLQNSILMVGGVLLDLKPGNSGQPQIATSDFRLGILDLESGDYRQLPIPTGTNCRECRIESVQDSRILIRSDKTLLAEYEID